MSEELRAKWRELKRRGYERMTLADKLARAERVNAARRNQPPDARERRLAKQREYDRRKQITMRAEFKRAVEREREEIVKLLEKDLEWASPNVAQYVENLIKLIRDREIM